MSNIRRSKSTARAVGVNARMQKTLLLSLFALFAFLPSVQSYARQDQEYPGDGVSSTSTSTPATNTSTSTTTNTAQRPLPTTNNSLHFTTTLTLTHLVNTGGSTNLEEAQEALQKDANLVEALLQEALSDSTPARISIHSIQAQLPNLLPYLEAMKKKAHSKRHTNGGAITINYLVRGICQGCSGTGLEQVEILFGSHAGLLQDQEEEDKLKLRGSPAPSSTGGSMVVEPKGRSLMASQEMASADFLTSLNKAMNQHSNSPESECSSSDSDCGKRGSKRKLQSTHKLEFLNGVLDLEERKLQGADYLEVVEYTCESTRNPLQDSLSLVLEGDWMDDNNLTKLETLLVNTYNDLSFGLCDWPYFRQLLNTTAQAEEYDTTINATTVTFSMEGECRDCPLDTPLFYETNSSLLEPEEELPTAITRQSIKQISSKACFCPKELNATAFRAPTLTEWIQELSTSSTLNGTAILNISAITNSTTEPEPTTQEVACSPNITTSTSYAFVDLKLGNMHGAGQELSGQAKTQLEAAFVATYNQLSYESCDPNFRYIKSVKLLGKPDQETNDEETSVSRSKQLVTGYYFSITSQCRGDCSSFVFGDPEERRGRYLQERINSSPLLERNLQEETNSCICPAEAAMEPVYHKDFLERINENLREEEVDISLEALEEAQEVDCNGEVQTFTSTVYVSVSVNLDAIGDEEKTLLEDAFKDSYNGLSFAVCDGLFRTVISANLEVETAVDPFASFGSQRSLLETNLYDTYGTDFNATNFTNYTLFNATNTTNTTNYTTPAPLPIQVQTTSTVFRVTGSCRNCQVSDSGTFTLFDDAFRRRRSLAEETPASDDYGILKRRGHPQFRNLQEFGDSCACPVGAVPGESTERLSAEVFKVVFNEQVEEEKEQGELSEEVVVVADSVLEGHEVECGSNVSSFKTEVFSDLTVNLTSLTKDEVAALEQSFQRIYNNLAFGACDGFFRAVESVQLRIGRPEKLYFHTRRLQEMEAGNISFAGNETFFGNETLFGNETANATVPPTAAPTTADVEVPETYVGATLFSIQGTCRNCPVSQTGSYTLFDDAFRRALSASRGKRARRSKADLRRQLQDAPSSCVCPVGEEPEVDEGLSARVFEEVFIEELTELADEGVAQSVTVTATSIAEGQEVSCSPDVQQFQTATYADLGVDPSTLSGAERKILEDSFLEAYNSLSFASCDGYFRLVAEVELVVDEHNLTKSRRLQEWIPQYDLNTTNATILNTTLLNGTFTNDTHTNETFPDGSPTRSASEAIFVISGRCRNCPVSRQGSFQLFDDSFRRSRRRKLQTFSHSPFSWRRNLEEDANLCICPPGEIPGEEPPPSVEEFVEELNVKIEEKVEEAIAEGENVTVNAIPTVEEVEVPEEVITGKTIEENVTRAPVTQSPTTMPPTLSPTNATLSPTSSAPTSAPTNATSPPTRTPTLAPTNATTAPVTGQPTPYATSPPSRKPTPTPTKAPTPGPTLQPTRNPTPQPTRVPTPNPTPQPTRNPTPQPTRNPTPQPTRNPTPQPTRPPTPEPTPQPTGNPTPQPTPEPTLDPTEAPSGSPSVNPSSAPSMEPTPQPSLDPTLRPSNNPSSSPSAAPSRSPSDLPSGHPTAAGCDQTLSAVQALYAVDYTGDATGLWDLELEESFTSADGATDKTACSSVVLSASVQSRTYARRLQGGNSARRLQAATVIFLVESLQTDTGFMFQTTADQEAFLSALNSIPQMQRNSIVAVAVRGTLGTQAPSSTPSNSPSGSPSMLPSQSPSSNPSDTPSEGPSEHPSAAPSNPPTKTPSLSPSIIPSQAPTNTASNTPSMCPSGSPSSSPSEAPSSLPSVAPSKVASTSPSQSSNPSLPPTNVPSLLPSTSPSASPTKYPSISPSLHPSRVPSSSPTLVPSTTPSAPPSTTPSDLPSLSSQPSSPPSGRPSSTPSACPSASGNPSLLPTATPSHSPSDSPSLSANPSQQPSSEPSKTPSAQPSVTPSSSPSLSSNPSALPSAIPSLNPSDSPSLSTEPSLHPSLSPSSSPSGCPSLSPSGGPSDVPSLSPSLTPSNEPSLVPSAMPSLTPSSEPSSTPSSSPSKTPSSCPSMAPSDIPSKEPSTAPSLSIQPSSLPSTLPSNSPSNAPSLSGNPSTLPSSAPSAAPSDVPSLSSIPSTLPSLSPSNVPSENPSLTPSERPSDMPSTMPSVTPSDVPSKIPSMSPSDSPSNSPSDTPSGLPSMTPSMVPSVSPSGAPSSLPSSSPSDIPSKTPSISPSDLPSSIPSPTPTAAPTLDVFNDNTELVNALNTGLFDSSSVYGPIEAWDVSRVDDFSSVLNGRTSFNEDISQWDTASATSFNSLCAGASSFNQNLNQWNTGSVRDMTAVFKDASSFNGDVSSWNVGAVTTMEEMFDNSGFNNNIASWNTAEVTVMTAMFQSSPFNSAIGSWNVAKVATFYSMFQSTAVFDQDISAWMVDGATEMGNMFNAAGAFNQDIHDWGVFSVTSAASMFSSATAFKQDLCAWGSMLNFNTDVSSMFSGAQSCPNQGDPSLFTIPGPFCYLCEYPCFADKNTLIGAIAADYTDNYASPYTEFGPIGEWCFDATLTDFSGLFASHTLTEDIDLWNVDEVTNMKELFYQCSYTGSLSSWNVGKVTSMHRMFQELNGATGSFDDDLSTWDVSKVTTFQDMFIGYDFSGDISGWNTGNCENFWGMFVGSSFNGDISGWNVAKATTLAFMFEGGGFNRDLSLWFPQLGLLTDAHAMFMDNTEFNQPLNLWNPSGVTDFSYMFRGATSFNQDISMWNIGATTSLRNMFEAASSFNQNMCAWGPFLNSLVDFTNMFVNTACTSTSDPAFQGQTVTPLCHVCF